MVLPSSDHFGKNTAHTPNVYWFAVRGVEQYLRGSVPLCYNLEGGGGREGGGGGKEGREGGGGKEGREGGGGKEGREGEEGELSLIISSEVMQTHYDVINTTSMFTGMHVDR